ncbi:protein turtle-like isoform X2 [Centruroides vittatus]|uniref:protein turtle-like isoform X2 n=1 Tax=Centruroides vittatus TaxID=120091 RepID=UPI00351022F7
MCAGVEITTATYTSYTVTFLNSLRRISSIVYVSTAVGCMTLEQEADFCFFHTIFSMVFQANQFLTSLWVLLTGLCGWVEGQATNEQPWASILYTAVVRGKVALPCDISPPSADDSVALILWYKDEAPTPIYTLDARYGKIEQARQSSSSELENRAYFNMINRPAFLQLDPVEEDDSGEYRCRVDFHTARTVNTVISLKVIVPPSKPVIKDSSGKQVKGLIGPYNEGESLVLTCEAEGGKPRPSVTWWRDYLLVDDTYTYDSGDTIVRNDLTIEKLRREDLLVVLTCQAINNNITVSASSYITLDLNLKPSTVEVQPKQRPLSAGKETEYTCVTSGARPKVVIAWWKGSEQIKTETPSDDSSSTIVFTPTIEDDGKYFYCRVYNPLIPSSALEDGWKLEIHYRPQVTLQIGKTLQRKHLQEGDDVHLECHIRSNPWINNIQWYFNGSELHNDIMAGIVISNQSLVLEKVQRTNRGIYSCSAKNQEGGGHSNDVYLPIRYAPVCSSSKTVYGVSLNEAVRVVCEVDADPNDVTFYWMFNNSARVMEIVAFTKEGMRSVTTYTPRTDDDYGSLICQAKNNVGIQHESCNFSIIPAAPPDIVQNCTVLNETEESLLIDCIEGYDGGLMQIFNIEIYDELLSRLQMNTTSVHPFFQLHGLSSGRTYRIMIYSVNSKGKSMPYYLSASTLQRAAKLTGMEGIIIIRPVLGLLISVVIILVIITVIITVFLQVRKKRKRQGTRNSPGVADKCETPLKKDTDDMLEGEEKGPDIIPTNTDSRSNYAGSRTISRHWSDPSTEGSIEARKVNHSTFDKGVDPTQWSRLKIRRVRG